MLAGAPRGLSEQFLLVRGFAVEMLSSLVLANLASVVTEPMTARRGVTFKVERICITDAGRTWLEGWRYRARASVTAGGSGCQHQAPAQHRARASVEPHARQINWAVP
jgi:hypothetical protein